MRAAQGSRNGPLSWSVVASLAVRILQSMFRTSCLPRGDYYATLNERKASAGTRVQTYVDDPAFTLRGTKRQRDRSIAIIILMWCAFGFDLSFRKAIRGRAVPWIGVRVSIHPTWVVATIKADRVSELLELTRTYLSKNVISVKDLRSYVAKASNFATLLFCWRPFLSELWAAVTSDHGSSGAPANCLWTKQILPSLKWLHAFLVGEAGAIVRVYTLSAFGNRGKRINICTDASPWGLGAAIFIDEVAVGWFSSALTQADFDMFDMVAGDPAGQQIWEALAVLVSMRIWSSLWRRSRVKLEVRADNVTALTMLTTLRAKGPGVTLISRELALDLGNGTFRPDVCAHAPGVSHVVADALSRQHAPGFKFVMPTCLEDCRETPTPARDRSFYRTLG